MNLLDFQDDAEFITFRCPYLKFSTGSLLLIATYSYCVTLYFYHNHNQFFKNMALRTNLCIIGSHSKITSNVEKT